MTAILAIEFPYQVLVLADARVSWEPNVFRPQDNLQKIYPLGPTGVVGFSGSIPAAKAIFKLAASDAERRPLPDSAEQIPTELADVARRAFSQIRGRGGQRVQLMYAGVDYSKIGLVADNIVVAKNVMAVMNSPGFEVRNSPRVIRLGYAERYPVDTLLKNRDELMRHGTTELGRRFQVGVAIAAIGPALARYGPERVGGLFTVAVATARGVGWWPHGSQEGYQLVIDSGRFIQLDNRQGRKIPLRTILEFDPYRPSTEDLKLDTPMF